MFFHSFFLALLTIAVIFTSLLTQADVVNECEEFQPQLKNLSNLSLPRGNLSNLELIPLFSGEEKRIDLEKKKNEGKTDLDSIKKSQVVEAEKTPLRPVKDKKLFYDNNNLVGRNIYGLLVGSNMFSRSVAGVNFFDFRFVAPHLSYKNSPRRSAAKRKTFFDVLNSKATLTTNDGLPPKFLPEGLKVSFDHRKYLPLIKQEGFPDWQQNIIFFDESFAPSEDFLVQIYISMNYKYNQSQQERFSIDKIKQSIKNRGKAIDNLISGTRIDNCFYLIVEK